MEIFGNEISKKDLKKAQKSQRKFIRKFGDDRNTIYHLSLENNEILDKSLGVKNIVIKENPEASFENQLKALPGKPIIIGNIRMGFGHYRISMAMASASKSLGFTPLWLDLNSFPQTTCTKIISYQNNLYSTGSRLSQKSKLFNKFFWEPMNYEGFKKLSYNVGDQLNSELMTSIFKEIPKDIPFIATHVWPAQAAIHAGMKNVINAIPDNWPMALHLAEGSIHTVQTYNSYFGYKTLHDFVKGKILKPIPDTEILYTGHYIDDELVSNIEEDCKKRIERANSGKPVRFLLTIGGAGAQGEFFASIIKTLIPYIKEKKACLYMNCGDYLNVWENLKKAIPEFNDEKLCTTHFNNWEEETNFANKALSLENELSSYGIHAFCNENIFAAVYITNLLMRASDVLVTKPSELAFYPIPKLFIRRVGGHEMWGAIHSAEIGDGTQECDTPKFACSIVKQMLENPNYISNMCNSIIINNKNKIYDGAYKVINTAVMEKK